MSASSSDPIMTQEKHAGNAGVRRLLPGRFDALMLFALIALLLLCRNAGLSDFAFCHQSKKVESVALSSDGHLAASLITYYDYGFCKQILNHGVRTVQLFSLDGGSRPRTIESASQRGAGRGGTVVWQWPANGPGVTFVLDFGNPTSLAFSPDGGTLAVASGVLASGRVYLWDLERQAGRLVETHSLLDTSLGMSGQAVTFLPNGRRVAVAAGDALIIHDLSSDRDESAILSEPCVADAAIAISPDGKTAVVGGGSHTSVWDLDPLRLRYITINGSSQSLSPDGRTLALSRVPSVLLFDLVRRKRIAESPRIAPGIVCFSPDGTLVAFTHDHQVDFLDPATAQIKSSGAFVNPESELTSIAFSPDSCLLAIGDRDGKVTVWEKKTGKTLHQFTVAEDGVCAPA